MHSAYVLQYPTIDTFVTRLTELGVGALMYKVDLSRAFRQLKVCPREYPRLCLFWKNEYYVDSAIAFGHRIGSLGMTRFSDSLRFIHSSKGFHLMTYVDDLLSAEIGNQSEASLLRRREQAGEHSDTHDRMTGREKC